MRNNNIDCLRVLCATLVVFIHIHCIGYYEWFEPVTRCAVPCFFVISGYFVYTSDGLRMSERLIRSIKTIWRIFLWSTAVYFVYELQKRLRGGVDIITFRQVASFFILDTNPFGFHLWYLSAYLYVLLITYFLNRKGMLIWLKYVTPFCLLFFLVCGKYDVPLLHHDFKIALTRNFFGCGLPFFTIGMWIKERGDSISKSDFLVRYSSLLAFAFAVLSIVEMKALRHFGAYSSGDLYVSSVPLTVFLFLSTVLRSNSNPSWLSQVGKEDSLYIYIFHILIGRGIHFALIHFAPESVLIVYMDFAALIVLIATDVAIRTVRWAFLSRK